MPTNPGEEPGGSPCLKYRLYGIPYNPLLPSAVDLRPYAHFGQLYKGLEKGAKRERESYATILHLSMYGVCDARACV